MMAAAITVMKWPNKWLKRGLISGKACRRAVLLPFDGMVGKPTRQIKTAIVT